MRRAVRKEGPRAPLFYSVAVLLLLSVNIATAQSVDLSSLEACSQFRDIRAEARLFRGANGQRRQGKLRAAAAAPQEPLPESAATEDALVTAGAAADVAASDVAENLSREDAGEEQAEVGDHPDREPPDEPQADVADNLGREDLDEDTDENENADVRANVSEVVKGTYDVLYFHFANGQVWRQIEPRRFRYPRDREFEVIISRGMMGDYRLRLDENSPMTPIRRVR